MVLSRKREGSTMPTPTLESRSQLEPRGSQLLRLAEAFTHIVTSRNVSCGPCKQMRII